jgi:hypothetical protein
VFFSPQPRPLFAKGFPIPDMKVTDCEDDWKTELRFTTTDRRGHFHFPVREARRSTTYASTIRYGTPWN